MKIFYRNTQTYVESIYPVTLEQNILNSDIISLNKKIEQLVKDYDKCVYIDIHSQLLLAEELNPSYTIDSIHLNEEGYAVVKDILTKYID